MKIGCVFSGIYFCQCQSSKIFSSNFKRFFLSMQKIETNSHDIFLTNDIRSFENDNDRIPRAAENS